MILRGFLNSVAAYPGRPAVEAGGASLTYSELYARATGLAAALVRRDCTEGPPLTAVFAYRSVTAYAGVLATLLRGHGYVPLNRTFPIERTRIMLQRAECRALVVDAGSEPQLDALLEGLDRPLTILLPDRASTRELADRWPRHAFVGASEIAPQPSWVPSEVLPESIAYLLFTSGSTGAPKGVMVSRGNVRHYVDHIVERYSVTCEDRFTQTFDMTFDLSVADMFVAWERGACVCCPSEKTLLNPGRWVNDARVTFWFSVPSTAVFMKRLGSLKPGAFPNLRVSLFCGEALPVEVAKAWAEAAPRSILENVYGPTELTIACTGYRWDPERSPGESALGVAPIGDPFPGMDALVVDEELREVGEGAEGELVMTGPQLSLGYWRDPEKTAKAFVTPPGQTRVFYRTGDRVRRPSQGQPMVYLGRMDNQIKVLGHRVELGEIEAVVREESKVDGVVAVGWPILTAGAGGIVAFLQTDTPPDRDLKQRVAARLPQYMVPSRFEHLPRFPLNANGKFDRHQLTATLKA